MILNILAALPAIAALQQGPAPASQSFPDQPVVVERMHERVRFENDGTGTRELSMRIRVQSEGGVQSLGQMEWPYNSGTETLKVDSVVVRGAAGTVVAGDDAIQDLSGPIATEAPMYTDLRQKVVTVPSLRPGDTLEVHVIWTTVTPVAPGNFWFQSDFARDGIILDERLEVNVPAGRYLKVKTAPGADPQVTEAGGRKLYRWRRQNLVTLNDSSLAELQRHPPDPSVQITTYKTWDEVGAWYEALARDREAPNEAMRATAARLVAGRKTLRDSLTALYDYVAKDFRYVSLSFGIGRYQPHSAVDVFTNKYGDCKDKHTLLAAMLRAVNLHADPVLISTGRDIDADVPSPAQFDHLISAIPSGGDDPLWLDTTPGLTSFGFLTSTVRNKHALVVRGPGQSTLLRTPVEPASPQRVAIETVGQLSALGTLKAQVRIEMVGDVELYMRLGFQAVPRGRWNEMAQGISQAWGMAGDISDVTVGDPGATSVPFYIGYQVSRSGHASWEQNRSEVNLPLPLGELVDSVTRDSAQVRLFGSREAVARLRLALPAGNTARLPVAVSLTRPYGSYRATYVRKEDSLIAARLLVYSGAGVVAANRNDYASFLRAIRNDQAQELVLTRTAGVTAESTVDATVAELYASGTAAQGNRDFMTAINLFRRVVKQDPRHADAWNDMGRAWQAMGMYDSAEVSLRTAVEVNPFHQFGWNNLGTALWRQQKYAEAEKAFLKQIEINPLDRFAHGNMGGMYLEQHRDSAAARELAQATEVRADDPSLWVNLGKALLALKEPDSARAAFDKAIELSPTPTGWNNIAYVYAEAGVNLDLAEKYARQAVDATGPTLRTASVDRLTQREWAMARSLASFWDTLGWVYFKMNRLEEAESYVGAAWQLGQHGEVGDHLGQIQIARGRKEEGIKTLAQAVSAIAATPDTRPRLEKAAKGRNVEVLVTQGKKDLTELKTVHVRIKTRDLSARANLLFSNGGKLEAVRFPKDSVDASLIAAMKAARYATTVPGTDSILLPRQAVVICDGPKSDCAVTLLEADRVTP